MKATYKPITIQLNWRTVQLEPGQFVTGRLQASKETGLSAQCVRTCLQALKSTSNITIRTTNRYSIITVINWNSYQAEENEINQQNNQHFNQPVTSSQPAGNHIQEVKKLRIKRKDITYPTDFESFWSNYPRKAKKDDALKAWNQRNGSRPPVELLNSKVNEFKKTRKWQDDNGQYIPYPGSWLRGGCWNDEVKIEIKKSMPGWSDEPDA